MCTLIPVYKPQGPTSTDIVAAYKNHAGANNVIHTGALDPMADGVLLLAVGTVDEREKESLMSLKKKYVYTGLLGFRTDTWDLLGLVTSLGMRPWVDESVLAEYITGYVGVHEQQVPIFSNMYYKNKRMYAWARAGQAHLVPPLFRQRTIDSHEFFSLKKLAPSHILEHIITRVGRVHGDFRQQMILQGWHDTFQLVTKRTGDQQMYTLWDAEVEVEKGTYVRSIVDHVGNTFGCGAVTWAITRTAVGTYTLNDCMQIPVE